ncbi:hypothetical protein FJT64_011982 [Amphibalanus amphitrite]|uniref:Uncharacterized protein n=1 Tax=Amphibalanus amphitrite TaxID=1232801 RepID=A0A6A4V9L8_AMPAM|nr:hypothetical protein FJT64_011982 [Amphibalanus amphitrite]
MRSFKSRSRAKRLSVLADWRRGAPGERWLSLNASFSEGSVFLWSQLLLINKYEMEQVSTPMAERLRDYLCYSHDVKVSGDSLNVQPGYSVYDLLQSSKTKTEADFSSAPHETDVSTPGPKNP